MSLILPRTWALALLLSLMSGCATYASIDNQPRHGVVNGEGYGLARERPGERQDQVTVVLAFSGGGARAAAMAYGVLQELHETRIPGAHGSLSLLDEVDAISAVSGGSFTAAYYGLHGDHTFPAFESVLLRRDLNSELLRGVLNPLRWFTSRGRTSEAIGLYDRTIFHGARFADLQARNGPLVIINASDFESGNRFAFLQGYFDLLCSDLLSYPIADAVAASSAVPVLFEPVVLENFGGCTSAAPVAKAPGDDSPQLQQAAEALRSYRDKSSRRYIHLVDGGLTDNLGLRAFQEAIDLAGGLSAFLRRIDRTPASHLVVISVDSSADAASGIGTSTRAPTLANAVAAMTDIQLHRYNAATIELMQDSVKRWTAEVSTPERPVQPHLIVASLQDVQDRALRTRLETVPTSFTLTRQQANELVAAGRSLLRDNADFRELLQQLGGTSTAH